MSEPRNRGENRQHVLLGRAVFRILLREVRLEEHRLGRRSRGGATIELDGKLGVVDAVNQRELPDGVPRLVLLEVSHEVPARGGAGLRDLRQRFLNAILSEEKLALGHRFANRRHGNRLRHGDQPHRGGIATGAIARAGDPLPDVPEPPRQIGHQNRSCTLTPAPSLPSSTRSRARLTIWSASLFFARGT